MKRRFSMQQALIALLMAAALPAFGEEPRRQPGASVESLLEVARQQNPELAAMRLEADAAAERVTPAGALPDPKFRTEFRDITKMGTQDATLSPSRVGSTKYLVMQDIPWFGKRDLKRQIAELEAEGARGKSFGTWAELAGRIKGAYAQSYYLARSERLTREILDLFARLETVARTRYAGGLATQQDVIRAQVEQSNLKTELVAIENQRRALHSRLNALLGRSPASPLADPEKLRPIPAPAKLDYAALEERVRARNPRLFADDARLKAAEKSRELTYKNRYPDFNIGISPIQYGNAVKEWELMVEINIPLQQGSRRAQEREAEAMLAAAKARKEATANEVLAELSEQLAGIDAARRTETLIATSLLPQSELSYRAAVAAYENGKVDFATLMEAQRQIRQAKQNQIKAQAEAQARLADIERLLGEEL